MRHRPLALVSLAALVLSTVSLLSPQIARGEDLKWDVMDLGPFQSGTYKVGGQITAKGIAIKVGTAEKPATVLFDTELLRWSAAWTGGFINFPRARGGLEGQISMEGRVMFSTGYAPGWGKAGEIGDDPRDRHQGHLPVDVAKWRGLSLDGEQVTLAYTVGTVAVQEVPGIEQIGEASVFTRSITVAPASKPLSVLIADLPGSNGSAEGNVLALSEQGGTDPATTPALLVAGLNLPSKAKLRVGGNGRALLDLPASTTASKFTLRIWSGPQAAAPKAADLSAPSQAKKSPASTVAKVLWGGPLETKGILSKGDGTYLADEIPFPEDNPFKSWYRPGGHDFFPDGRVAVASISGDVWIVSGLEGGLESVKWKRFATGLFQPLGVKVVRDEIYVLGRDQITRLRDTDHNGEADHYDCFNNDCVVTDNYHEFALDLQTDRAGNFYFAKGSPWQPTVMSPHQGTLLKVSADGSKMEVVATGLRAPNGMNIGPNDEIAVSDNQGHWMPSNRLNIIKPGGFYGMVPAAHRQLTFKGREGEYKADPSNPKDQAEHRQNFWGSPQTPTPREGYDLPLCWIPMVIDNSSGGEVWVPEGRRWGPLAGHMLQLSYGKCALFDVLPETVGGVAQAALVRFPVKFSSGVMRGRFSPADGQLYLSGLRVWQTDASKDGCFYRVRYTGKPYYAPMEMHTLANGVELRFDSPLDPKTAADAENYNMEEWNYLWSGAYGSPDFSVRDPEKKGRDSLTVKSATLSPDGRKVTLVIEDLRPAMQTHLKFKIKAADGHDVEQELYGTIHRVPAT